MASKGIVFAFGFLFCWLFFWLGMWVFLTGAFTTAGPLTTVQNFVTTQFGAGETVYAFANDLFLFMMFVGIMASFVIGILKSRV
jgi:hypothetical protein